jgi:hypothetical protein
MPSRKLLNTACLACCVCVAGVRGIANGPDIATFSGNSLKTFEDLSSEGRLLLLCPLEKPTTIAGNVITVDQSRDMAEKLILTTNLIEETRFTVGGAWGGRWSGKNITGNLSLLVSCPEPFGQRNVIRVEYVPPTIERLPDPMLTFLLQRASSSEISGADSIDLTFKVLTAATKCSAHRTLSIGLSTASVEWESFELSCLRQ